MIIEPCNEGQINIFIEPDLNEITITNINRG